MTKRQVRQAYEEIRLTRQEKDLLLNNILSASNRVHPDGKDSVMRKRTLKPFVIVAIVALMVLLMGSAWALLNLDDLIIGQYTYQENGYVDEAGDTVPPREYTKEVISLQGIEGTPNYQAAAEWYAYEQDYITNHWEKIDNFFERPSDYQAYHPGNQEMVDKIDEICEKYGLKLAGEVAITEPWDVDVMFEHLGFDTLLRDKTVETDDRGGYFYACGNFNHSFEFYIDGAESDWKVPILASLSYRDKEYLDTVYWTFDPEDCRQWSYTCGDGTQVLIVTTGDVANILCDRQDAFLSVHVFTVGYLDDGTEVRMIDRDLELIAEAIDFTVKPNKPDMELAKRQLEEATEAYEATKPVREPYTYADVVQWQINGRMSEEQLYYCLYDYGADGAVDLLLGYEDKFNFMFSINSDGEPGPAVIYDDGFAELAELWLTLDIIPVEEFPFDEY
ncbi:MAG: hypothetical protein IJA75_06060 [Oscillospiraceae bacterium]|nr:hypothetical protein [Oscillospiraceae bacterium]